MATPLNPSQDRTHIGSSAQHIHMALGAEGGLPGAELCKVSTGLRCLWDSVPANVARSSLYGLSLGRDDAKTNVSK